jgi:hypothetical protein
MTMEELASNVGAIILVSLDESSDEGCEVVNTTFTADDESMSPTRMRAVARLAVLRVLKEANNAARDTVVNGAS